MNISPDQAIVIYAHACRKWFGEKAALKMRERCQQLAAHGDEEGAAIHEAVRAHIESLDLEETKTQH